MAGLQRFRYIDAAFIIGSIITFILDQATGGRMVGNSFDIIQSWGGCWSEKLKVPSVERAHAICAIGAL